MVRLRLGSPNIGGRGRGRRNIIHGQGASTSIENSYHVIQSRRINVGQRVIVYVGEPIVPIACRVLGEEAAECGVIPSGVGVVLALSPEALALSKSAHPQMGPAAGGVPPPIVKDH